MIWIPDALVRLRRLAVSSTGIGITAESIESAINGSHRGWLFEEDGEVGGFAMGNFENAELTVIAVLQAHEGKGVGGLVWFLSQPRMGRLED